MEHLSSDAIVEIILALLCGLGVVACGIAGWLASAIKDVSKDAADSLKEISKDVGDVKILLGVYFQELKDHKERTDEKFKDTHEKLKEIVRKGDK